MDPSAAVEMVKQALWTASVISLPLLVLCCVVGLVVSLLQVVTSLQDPAFSALLRLAAFLAGVVLLLPWMLTRLMGYTSDVLGHLGRYAR